MGILLLFSSLAEAFALAGELWVVVVVVVASALHPRNRLGIHRRIGELGSQFCASRPHPGCGERVDLTLAV